VLNLLLGWTLIGWVASLVWACTADTRSSNPPISTAKPNPPTPAKLNFDKAFPAPPKRAAAPRSRVKITAVAAVFVFVGALWATGVVLRLSDDSQPVPASSHVSSTTSEGPRLKQAVCSVWVNGHCNQYSTIDE
jgi:hypothetical protein